MSKAGVEGCLLLLAASRAAAHVAKTRVSREAQVRAVRQLAALARQWGGPVAVRLHLAADALARRAEAEPSMVVGAAALTAVTALALASSASAADLVLGPCSRRAAPRSPLPLAATAA